MSAALADILREIDARELFEMTKGLLPFLPLDGHGSRAEFEIIECMSDSEHD